MHEHNFSIFFFNLLSGRWLVNPLHPDNLGDGEFIASSWIHPQGGCMHRAWPVQAEAVCLLVALVIMHRNVFCQSDYCYLAHLSGINLSLVVPVKLVSAKANLNWCKSNRHHFHICRLGISYCLFVSVMATLVNKTRIIQISLFLLSLVIRCNTSATVKLEKRS